MVDFSKYANTEVLGDGEAKQKLRKFEDDWQVTKKELEQAKTKIEGTSRLFEKGFVPRTELVSDEIAHESSRLKVQTAETARELFLKYEFPKTAEEWLSKYADAVREQDKARRVAISRLAQARARLNSAKGQYDVQLRQRQDLSEQLGQMHLAGQENRPGRLWQRPRGPDVLRGRRTSPRRRFRPRTPGDHHDSRHDPHVGECESPRELHQEGEKGIEGAHHRGCFPGRVAHRRNHQGGRVAGFGESLDESGYQGVSHHDHH